MSRLALHGGVPVRRDPLPYGRQSINAADVAAVAEMLRSPLLTTGPHVARFEALLAERCGVAHAVAVTNGTAALHAAYVAAGLGPGDEVIVPPLTFAATAACVMACGARPVFADIDPVRLVLDPQRVAEVVTPRTRFVVAVDFAGHCADYEALRAAAGVPVLSDSAHGLGARRGGVPAQSLVDAATLSFHPVKHITTGEGGAIVTNDLTLAERARRFRQHNLSPDPDTGPWAYVIDAPGMNYRLPDINAALGVSQLGRLDDFLERRRALARRYEHELLRFETEVERPEADDDSAWHLYPIRLRGRFSTQRRFVFEALRAEGIGVQLHYAPLHHHPAFAELAAGPEALPVSVDYGRRALSLPLFPAMTDADQDDVLLALAKILEDSE